MFFKSGDNLVKPKVFVSLDGWGIAPPSKGNAVYLAKTPNYKKLLADFPNTQVIASGESVGLPANEVGNSEVGHLTMGVGRVIYQSLERINFAVREEAFYQNRAFLDAMTYVKAKGGTLHLLGLVGSGNVHSSLNHLYALLELCKRTNCSNLLLHLITDGRDSPPQEGMQIIQEIEKKLREEIGFGRIASIAGRYYSMDRDGRWERVKPAYEAVMLGKGKVVTQPSEAFTQIYAEGKSDEFVPAAVVASGGVGPHRVEPRDVVIFFNFRVDRARELTMAMTMPDFEKVDPSAFGFDPNQTGFALDGPGGVTTFRRENWPQGLKVVTMTEYQKGIPVTAIAFPLRKELIIRCPRLCPRPVGRS